MRNQTEILARGPTPERPSPFKCPHQALRLLYLDEDLPLEHRRRRQPSGLVHFDVGHVQLVPQDLGQVLGHLLLLGNAAVVLDGEDDRVAERQPHNPWELREDSRTPTSFRVGCSPWRWSRNHKVSGSIPSIRGRRQKPATIKIILLLLSRVEML